MSEHANNDLDGIDYSRLRRHVRHIVCFKCQIFFNDSSIAVDALLTNISLGGVSFVYKEIIPNDTILRIEFIMPGKGKVAKHIEIRRFHPEVKAYLTNEGEEFQGFEHGARFIALKVSNGAVPSEQGAPPQNTENEFVLKNHHVEFFSPTDDFTVLHHCITKKMNSSLIFFETLFHVQQGEKLPTNLIISEDDRLREEVVTLEVKSVTKSDKLYMVEGEKVGT